MLTSQSELRTYNGQKWTLSSECTEVDAIVNTIGFPLVGGPAGSMEGGEQIMVFCILVCIHSGHSYVLTYTAQGAKLMFPERY